MGTGTFSAPAAPPRPNTYMHYEMSSPHSTPMPPIPLNVDAWGELLARYPDKVFGQTVALIACCEAKLGYQGSKKLLYMCNLPTAELARDFLDRELERNLQLHRVRQYSVPPSYGIFSPLGAVPKDETSWWKIHHLSSPKLEHLHRSFISE